MNSSAYLYIFAGRPIRFPILASLQNAFPQLLGGTLPLTVLLSEGDSRPRYAEKNERILVEWIRSAWYRYQEVCGS